MLQQQIEYLRSFDADDDIDNFSLNFVRPTVAKCVRVIDGDTIVCCCKFDFMAGPTLLHCRLAGCDTSEIRGGSAISRQLAQKAKEYVINGIADKMLLLVFGKFDAFGRVLVKAHIIDNGVVDMMSLTEHLIAAGHAIEYNHMDKGVRKNTLDDEYTDKSVSESGSAQPARCERTVDDLIAIYAKMNLETGQ